MGLLYTGEDGYNLKLLNGAEAKETSCSSYLPFTITINGCYLAEYADYDPTIPWTLPVPTQFGSTLEMLVDGYMPEKDALLEMPTVEFVGKDIDGKVLTIQVDPSYSIMTTKTSLDQWGDVDFDISTDYGKPFQLTAQYNAADFSFSFTFNGFSFYFDIPEGTADIDFESVTISGSVEVTFIGFTEPDSITAVPVGTIVKYQCPELHVFENDWDRKPVVLLTCKDDGLFQQSTDWSKCIYRKCYYLLPCFF